MSRLFLIGRLGFADVRRHPVEAALLLLAITSATATLALGLVVQGVTNNPYQRTRAATAGPDVVVGLLNLKGAPVDRRRGPGDGHETLFTNDEHPSKQRTASFNALAHAAGVASHSGPFPVAWGTLGIGGKTAGVAIEGRGRKPAAVDQPLVTQGHWFAAGDEAVVEAGYAAALGIQVGDHVTLDGKSFQVVGLAVTAAVPDYPNAQDAFGGSPFPDPGLVWVNSSVVKQFATSAIPLSYILNLKLHSPAGAPAFIAAHGGLKLSLMSSAQILKQDAKLVAVEQRALKIGSWLLSLLAVASVAVLVGGRMAEQERRVGLLKAVGATPGLVAGVLLAEHLTLALVAAAIGLLISWLAAPLITAPGAGLLGSAGAPSITASNVAWVVAVALGVAVAATFVPALRAARLSTIRALADAARAPSRRSRLIGLSTRLPVPFLLGLRLAARRPRRTTLAALSVAITVTTVVAVITVRSHQELMTIAGFSSIDNPRTDRINHSLLLISLILVVLAAINALVVTWSTTIDARQPLTITRALGATPRQITLGLAAAQVIPAVFGAILGIPAGVALVALLSHGDKTTAPAAVWLGAVFVGTLVAVALLSSIPASISSRRPVAEVLRAELA